MNPDSPSRTPVPAAAPRASRTRIGRMAALAAGATLGLGALAVPPATVNSGGAAPGSPLTLVADTNAPTVVLGATAVKPGGEVPFTAAGQVQADGKLHFTVTKFPAGRTVTIKLDDERSWASGRPTRRARTRVM